MLKTVSSITNAIGALNFKGTWNASTNTPTLASGVGTKGDYFVVSVAGTTTLDGISNWGVGDWATYNGTTWQRVEGGADLNGVNISFTGTASGPTYETSNLASGLTMADNEIDADGTDTNIDVLINPKGTGGLGVGGNTTGVVAGTTITSKFCVKHEGANQTGGFVHVNDTTAASGAGIFACRSRGTLAAPTIVQDNDNLATISFAGGDGVDLALAARISVEVDGTPGSNDMPGRMVFLTTPDGSQTPVEALRINSVANVGIGTSSPTARLSVSGVTPSLNSGDGQLSVFSTDAIGADKGGKISLGGVSGAAGFDPYGFAAIAGLKNNATPSDFSGYISLRTADIGGTVAERMRITSAGNLLVNRTTAASFGQYSADFTGTSLRGAVYNNTEVFTASNFVSFTDRGTIVGTIVQNGASTVNYATTSDYRLKEQMQPMTDALARVALLKPCTYKWKIDGSEGEGFIAHELQEVCPSAVTGVKDEIDADGKPVHQGIDTSFLVATLTAAIQEQQALITALTARVTALEAN